MTPEIISAVIRHILTAVGGYFVAKGTVDQAAVEAIVGGVVAAVGLGWSLIAKIKKD
jgi:hypothetical protein